MLLSRIDAGTLVIERAASDVFTLLTLAADNLQELSAQAGVSIDILEMGEIKRSNRNLNQTILLITHDEKIALESDRIVVIEDGKIVRDHLERQR